MRILVVGGGSVGLVLTAKLAVSSYDVWLGVRREEQGRKIGSEGISVYGPGGEVLLGPVKPSGILVGGETASSGGSFDVIVYATKSYDLMRAVEMFSPFAVNDTVVTVIQISYRCKIIIDPQRSQLFGHLSEYIVRFRLAHSLDLRSTGIVASKSDALHSAPLLIDRDQRDIAIGAMKMLC